MFKFLEKLLQPKKKEVKVSRSEKDGDNLTEYEMDFIDRGGCPDCETGKLLMGPRGGMSINVTCDTCGSKFNVVPGIFGERISLPSPNRKKE